MQYFNIKTHGNRKVTVCFMDNSWTAKFTAALQPVFLYQNLITVFIVVSETGVPLAHKIVL